MDSKLVSHSDRFFRWNRLISISCGNIVGQHREGKKECYVVVYIKREETRALVDRFHITENEERKNTGKLNFSSGSRHFPD